MTSRPLAVLAAVLTAAMLVATGCTGKDAVDQGASGRFRFVSGTDLGKTYPLADRKQAGDFTADLLAGDGTLSLSQQAGKVVVVNFWAMWCGPCTVETPQFDTVYRDYKNEGVQFIGVDTKDLRGKAQSFVKDNDISYPMVFDEKGEAALRLGDIPTQGLPFTVLVDKHQRVAAVYVGIVSPKDLTPVLDELIAET
jgi:peroxiredoxin